MAKIKYNQSKKIKIEDNVLAWVDKDTNLMWEVKNSDNIRMMYAWYKRYVKDLPTVGPDDRALLYEPKVKDATSYVERLNKIQYAGFSDWRLPTVKELESLIDHEGTTYLIKKPLRNNTAPAYWTCEPTQVVHLWKTSPDFRVDGYIDGIKIVNFNDATTGAYKPGYGLWVRCVRNREK